MRVLGIIPARGGSKEIPRKNIKLFGGKPLIQYTIEQGLAANGITDLIVSTEDPEIASLSEKLNAKVPGLRPQELATDQSPSIDTVLYTLQLMMDAGNTYDMVCLLQPTTPFRSKGLIDRAIRMYQNSKANSLISVRSVPHQYNPHWTYEEKAGFLQISTGEKEVIPRRQQLPNAYFRDGAVYLTDCKILLKKKSLYGDKLTYLENSSSKFINLDSMDDWALAEQILKNHMND